jgi:hypothetical protein
MVKFAMVRDLTPKDRADFQRFIDFSVETGTISEKVDVKRFLHQF